MSVIPIPRVWSKEQKDNALNRIAAAKYGPELKLEDWQREATRHLLSGNDVLLQAPTGAGKSLPFHLYALARPDETVIIVSPLKMLEQDMVSAVALNADTELAALREGRNLWRECAEGRYRVVFCSPEQLASPKMSKLLEKPSFRRRVRLVVVDEVHLIPIWGGKVDGRSFRRAFMAIGSLRSRLDSSRAVFLALSATLMPGSPTRIVESSLGLQGPNYHRIKLNCVRENLHLVLRRIHSSLASGVFDDLDWLLQEVLDPKLVDKQPSNIPKTIIYVDSISRGWEIVQYLRKRLPSALSSRADEIIRHIHSSTCPECKQEILDAFSRPGDTRLRIVVATDVFGCGINIPDVLRVVNYGTPRDFPTGYQRAGRAGRKLAMGWGFIYINSMLWDDIISKLGIQDRSGAKRIRRSKKSLTEGAEGVKGCPHIRQLVAAHLQHQCLTIAINHIYKTQGETGLEPCEHCSGCVEDILPGQSNQNAPKKARQRRPEWLPKSKTRGAGQVRQKTSARVQQKISHVIVRAYLSIPTDFSRIFDGPEDFLPEATVALIAKYLRDLDTPDLIHRMIGNDWAYWGSHGQALSRDILGIREVFIAEIEEVRLEELAKKQGGSQGLVAADGSDDEVDDEVNESMDVDEDERPRLIIRIPPRRAISQERNRSE